MNHSNLEKSEEIYHILNDLNYKGNLEGIIFVYRDGGVISEIIGDELNNKKFTSMCASVLESALGIGETIGDRKINKIVAELAEKTILLFECDSKTFLILIIKKKTNTDFIFSELQEVIQTLAKLY